MLTANKERGRSSKPSDGSSKAPNAARQVERTIGDPMRSGLCVFLLALSVSNDALSSSPGSILG